MNTQAAEALSFANERRCALAEIRARIQALPFEEGCELVASILDQPEGHEEAFPVGRMLLSVHRFGEQALATALREAGVLTADKKVRQLTERQRRALALVLRGRAAGYRRGPRGSGA